MIRKTCPFVSVNGAPGDSRARCSSKCAMAVLEIDADGTPSGRWRCGLVPPVLEFGEMQGFSGEPREGFGPKEAPGDHLE